MNKRVVLRNRVWQFDQVAKEKRKYAAGAARLWLVRVGVCKATVVIETQALYPFHVAQGRGRAKADQTLFLGEPLPQGRECAKVLFAAEQAAVVRESVGSKLEPTRPQIVKFSPVNPVLIQGKVERRAKSILFFKVGHAPNLLETDRTLNVVGQDNAAPMAQRPEPDVRSVPEAQSLETLPHPVAPEVYQRGLAGPVRKIQPLARADRDCVETMAQRNWDQALDEIVKGQRERSPPVM